MADRNQEQEAWGPPSNEATEAIELRRDERDRARIRNMLDTTDSVAGKGWRRPTKVGSPPLVVFHDLETRWVEVRGRLALPEAFVAIVTEPDHPWTVLDLAVEDREVVCNRVSFVRTPEGPPLRASQLRRRLDSFQKEAASLAAARLGERADGTPTLIRNDFTSEEYAKLTDRIRHERRRGRRLTDEELREAAEIYRAELAGGKPIKALMKAKHLSHSTAHRWVAEARERDFLEQHEVARPKKKKTARRRTRRASTRKEK